MFPFDPSPPTPSDMMEDDIGTTAVKTKINAETGENEELEGQVDPNEVRDSGIFVDPNEVREIGIKLAVKWCMGQILKYADSKL